MQKAGWKDDWGLVLPASDGSLVHPQNFRKRVWHPALQAAKLPPARYP